MGYAVEWFPSAAALGLVTLLLAPYLGLLIALVIVVVAAAAPVALVGAVVATPYLLGRSVLRHRRARTDPDRPRRPAFGRFAAIQPALERAGREVPRSAWRRPAARPPRGARGRGRGPPEVRRERPPARRHDPGLLRRRGLARGAGVARRPYRRSCSARSGTRSRAARSGTRRAWPPPSGASTADGWPWGCSDDRRGPHGRSAR